MFLADLGLSGLGLSGWRTLHNCVTDMRLMLGSDKKKMEFGLVFGLSMTVQFLLDDSS